MTAPTLTTLRPNFTRVGVGDLTLWYSYRTCVAFHAPGRGTVVRWNDWGPTTGKHLNAIDGGLAAARAARVGGSTFVAMLGALTESSALEMAA